jgi:hypothetical protein
VVSVRETYYIVTKTRIKSNIISIEIVAKQISTVYNKHKASLDVRHTEGAELHRKERYASLVSCGGGGCLGRGLSYPRHSKLN